MFTQTWNDKFHLPDEPWFVSNIQDYVEYIIKKKHKTAIDNPPTRTNIKKSAFIFSHTGFKKWFKHQNNWPNDLLMIYLLYKLIESWW